LPFVPSWHAQE